LIGQTARFIRRHALSEILIKRAGGLATPAEQELSSGHRRRFRATLHIAAMACPALGDKNIHASLRLFDCVDTIHRAARLLARTRNRAQRNKDTRNGGTLPLHR